MTAPLVVGVDLSITATGICHPDGSTRTVGGKASEGDGRIHRITEAIIDDATVNWTEYDEDGWPTNSWDHVDLVAVEGLAIHGPGGALAAAQLMGALKHQLLERDVPYVEVPPSTLKKFATGRGNATKADMAVALFKRFGLELANDNEVDAWWLRAAGLHALGVPLVDLPKAQTDALAKVEWPTHLLREDTPNG